MGNTRKKVLDKVPFEDHPHIHGEYTFLINQTVAGAGSPPHTWGILLALSLATISIRITPTYMGNTVNRSLYDAFFRSLVCHF